jgi:hypothetical protein
MIENYLGFPNGISGTELATRAVAQARRFGAELLLARSLVGLSRVGRGTAQTSQMGRVCWERHSFSQVESFGDFSTCQELTTFWAPASTTERGRVKLWGGPLNWNFFAAPTGFEPVSPP